MDETKKVLGISMPFKVGTEIQKIHPIVLKNWLDFSKYVGIFELKTLYEIHLYGDGRQMLEEALKMVCQTEELPEIFLNMTQGDYQRLRELIIEQNDLNFEEWKEMLGKKTKEEVPPSP